MIHVAGGVERAQNPEKEDAKQNDQSAKKKKRPRIRIRARNKCRREAEGTSVTATTSETVSTTEHRSAPAMKPTTAGGQTREQVLAEREAKKLAKQAKKGKTTEGGAPAAAAVAGTPLSSAHGTSAATGSTREHVLAERAAKKVAKQVAKVDASGGGVTTPALSRMTVGQGISAAVTEQMGTVKITGAAAPASTAAEQPKKPTLTKAERRAIQEAQRAAKAQGMPQKLKTPPAAVAVVKPKHAAAIAAAGSVGINVAAKNAVISSSEITATPTKKPAASHMGKRLNDCKVRLFNHLQRSPPGINLFVNNAQLHPAIAGLGVQYEQRTVVGSNARCIGFLNALKAVIHDFETPPKKAFSRSLETCINHCVEHLQCCRPLAVSVVNAHKHIKHVLTQLPGDQPEAESKEHLCHFIDTYIENQIGKAAQAISSSMQEKISNGDVILTFGCSSLISYICEEAHRRHVDFRVIVVDSRPFCEGQELLRRLISKGIPSTYVLINAVSFVMPEVTRVLLGAHALLANGYVMGRAGTAQVALVAHAFNVPVLVCCETHKFSERYQTDAIVYNELGNPDDLVLSDKCCLNNWQSKPQMAPLNLIYDITPPELVTAVVTEVSILPCSSVPVILRIKPAEIGYYC